MNDTLITLITSAPSAVAVIYVSQIFLKEIRAQREAYFAESRRKLEVLSEISNNVAGVVKENTTQLARVGMALERCEVCRHELKQQHG